MPFLLVRMPHDLECLLRHALSQELPRATRLLPPQGQMGDTLAQNRLKGLASLLRLCWRPRWYPRTRICNYRNAPMICSQVFSDCRLDADLGVSQLQGSNLPLKQRHGRNPLTSYGPLPSILENEVFHEPIAPCERSRSPVPERAAASSSSVLLVVLQSLKLSVLLRDTLHVIPQTIRCVITLPV